MTLLSATPFRVYQNLPCPRLYNGLHPLSGWHGFPSLDVHGWACLLGVEGWHLQMDLHQHLLLLCRWHCALCCPCIVRPHAISPSVVCPCIICLSAIYPNTVCLHATRSHIAILALVLSIVVPPALVFALDSM